MKLILKALLITIGKLTIISGVILAIGFVMVSSKWAAPILCSLAVFGGVFVSVYTTEREKESK